MNKHTLRTLSLLACCVATGVQLCYADAVQSLEKFLHNRTLGANFTQTVYGKKKNRVTTGSMEISRPNKFLWQYDDGQSIISDGEKIYLYDKSLQEVTIKKLTQSLGKSPALLLAGGNDIKKYYTVVKKPDADNLEWVSLIPIANKVADNNGFKLVDIGFNKQNQSLTQMKFVDGFDNKSSIEFTAVKVGVQYPNKTFMFKVPAGTDVINSNE